MISCRSDLLTELGFHKNPKQNTSYDFISASIKSSGTQAPQTYNDMGTTTKNVRQWMNYPKENSPEAEYYPASWTVEDIPLEPLSDKNIPVKKLHTKLP